MDSEPPVVTPPYVAKPLRFEPFRALRLNPRHVGDPASARAFARPYRAVAKRLQEWARRGRVTQDDAPALYVHEYAVGGLTVRGLVGALAIDRRADSTSERAVWPHEGIHPAQAQDLASRMREMALNPAPILLVHEGPAPVRALLATIIAREPLANFGDRAGQQHRVWGITDQAEIDQINEGLTESVALIADGHHRYAAYLSLQEQQPGTAWDLGLAMLVDQTDTPLFLGAIHRTFAGCTHDQLAAAAVSAGGTVTPHPRQQALDLLAPSALVITDSHAWSVVVPPASQRGELVEWLHEDVVPRLTPAPSTVAFHHSANGALEHTHRKKVAALLPAPSYAAVRDLVRQGSLLPEKATSFQPKPSLGVLMRPVPQDDGPDDRH